MKIAACAHRVILALRHKLGSYRGKADIASIHHATRIIDTRPGFQRGSDQTRLHFGAPRVAGRPRHPTGKSGSFLQMSQCHGGHSREFGLNATLIFARRFKPMAFLTRRVKNFGLRKSEIVHLCSRPAPIRGAFRDRHEIWRRDAMDEGGIV